MKKPRRGIIGRIIAVLIALGFCAALSYGWLVAWVASREFEANQQPNIIEVARSMETDCIIVLGAQVKPEGIPSEALLRRMQLALENYTQSPRLIICCGGKGADEPIAEGDFMREWFIRQGVPGESVVSENMSVNTKQNLENAKRIMGEFGVSSALVVTSDYHVARALAICDSAGIKAIGVGSASRPELWWKNHTREALAWIKYWLDI